MPESSTGLRVVCFNAANPSPPRPEDPGWPRITAVGFELPGEPSGFSLVFPVSAGWAIVEQQEVAIPGRGTVMLDFALVTHVNPVGWSTGGPLNPGHPAWTAGLTSTPQSDLDGQRFLINVPLNQRAPRRSISVVLNWPALLKR